MIFRHAAYTASSATSLCDKFAAVKLRLSLLVVRAAALDLYGPAPRLPPRLAAVVSIGHRSVDYTMYFLARQLKLRSGLLGVSSSGRLHHADFPPCQDFASVWCEQGENGASARGAGH